MGIYKCGRGFELATTASTNPARGQSRTASGLVHTILTSVGHMLLTFGSRLFGSAPMAFKVKSNDLWTSLAAVIPCVTMAVSNLRVVMITSGGFPGWRHVYRSFIWFCSTCCTIAIPILVDNCLSPAVKSRTLSRISRHVWIWERKFYWYYTCK